ncbi:TPA: hypothetical protein N0F65_002326 [Lagenidium giganteum]|uniref:Transmembrane protein n=1 Tax=Lagenidium giganteum TaxID=4803 RepID=A0AAV2Z471_9STRA|nr:TPA: hypothetical protein N0F65_002326 [Lagenidium giganteum]
MADGHMAIQFGVAYLMVNGFSALNVQLENGKLTTLMDESDLGDIRMNQSSSDPLMALSAAPGTRPPKRVVDTVLRNALLPFEISSQQECDESGMEHYSGSISYGFALKSWQRYMMTALNTVFDSAKATHDSLPPDRTVEKIKTNPLSITGMDAYNLHPNTSNPADEIEWFLKQSSALFNTSIPANVSRLNSTMTVERVQLTSDAIIDSLTFDYVMRKDWLSLFITPAHYSATSRVRSQGFQNLTNMTEATMEQMDFTYTLDAVDQCGVNMPVCKLYLVDDDLEPATGFIGATQICLNEQGTEDLTLKEFVWYSPKAMPRYQPRRMLLCNGTSTTSFYVLSASSRIAGDTMTFQAPPDNTTDPLVKLMNARKIYSFTISRVSWTPRDLAMLYGATCKSANECDGLRYELNDETNAKQSNHLLVGQGRIPFSLMTPLHLNRLDLQYKVQPLPLVTLTPPFTKSQPTQGSDSIIFSEQALAHTFGRVDWTAAASALRGANVWNDSVPYYRCSWKMDEHLQTIVNNRMFMDGDLQPVYTAAMFFLFQNAAVKAQLPNTNGKMLKLNSVVQSIKVVASIPMKNAVLTVCGCSLLLLTCVAVVFFAMIRPNRLEEQVDADTAVRVLINEWLFPPLLLSKKIDENDTSSHKPDVPVLEPPIERAELSSGRYQIERVAIRRAGRQQSEESIRTTEQV